MMSAIEVGPVAAPGIEPSTRIAMSASPLQANAVSAAPMVKPAKPSR